MATGVAMMDRRKALAEHPFGVTVHTLPFQIQIGTFGGV
jgi:non-ribosomal peptide synthetase component F